MNLASACACIIAAAPAFAGDFNTPVEKLAGHFKFTEGPVWVAAKGELLFSDIPANRIVRFKDGKLETFRTPSDNANGLTLDKQGRLIACEHGARRVTRTEADGAITVLAERYEGKRLNSPNDVVVKSDGFIYFTDPPYGVKADDREMDFQGVYRIAPDGKAVTLLARDFVKPNGLAFTPDEKVLYINDTERGHIRAFDVAADWHGRERTRIRANARRRRHEGGHRGQHLLRMQARRHGVRFQWKAPRHHRHARTACQLRLWRCRLEITLHHVPNRPVSCPPERAGRQDSLTIHAARTAEPRAITVICRRVRSALPRRNTQICSTAGTPLRRSAKGTH